MSGRAGEACVSSNCPNECRRQKVIPLLYSCREVQIDTKRLWTLLVHGSSGTARHCGYFCNRCPGLAFGSFYLWMLWVRSFSSCCQAAGASSMDISMTWQNLLYLLGCGQPSYNADFSSGLLRRQSEIVIAWKISNGKSMTLTASNQFRKYTLLQNIPILLQGEPKSSYMTVTAVAKWLRTQSSVQKIFLITKKNNMPSCSKHGNENGHNCGCTEDRTCSFFSDVCSTWIFLYEWCFVNLWRSPCQTLLSIAFGFNFLPLLLNESEMRMLICFVKIYACIYIQMYTYVKAII